jgi:hypothetical protein
VRRKADQAAWGKGKLGQAMTRKEKSRKRENGSMPDFKFTNSFPISKSV